MVVSSIQAFFFFSKVFLILRYNQPQPSGLFRLDPRMVYHCTLLTLLGRMQIYPNILPRSPSDLHFENAFKDFQAHRHAGGQNKYPCVMCVCVCVCEVHLHKTWWSCYTATQRRHELVLMEEILNHLGCKRCKTLAKAAKATWAGTETSSISSMTNKNPLQDIPFIDHNLSWCFEEENP